MDALWIAVSLLVGVLGGWPVTAGILALAKSRTIRAVDAAESGIVAQQAETLTPGEPAPEGGQPEPTPEAGLSDRGEVPRAEVLRGGLLIGMLERAAVAVAILSGQPLAIAYVVAIKGLGRYPELKSTPAASERFIIGTLASMLFSASVAVLTKALLL